MELGREVKRGKVCVWGGVQEGESGWEINKPLIDP